MFPVPSRYPRNISLQNNESYNFFYQRYRYIFTDRKDHRFIDQTGTRLDYTYYYYTYDSVQRISLERKTRA